MNKSSIFLIIAILIVVIAGAWWALSMQGAPAPAVETGQVQGAAEENRFPDSSKDGAAAGVTVRYTADGFSPSTVTVKKGTAVTFVNETTGEMWVASDEHPTHTGYDGTNKDEHCAQSVTPAFDQCGVGQAYTFVFDKAGTWSFHNHREDDDHGTVVVTE